jgi:hypothetical protein
VRRASRGAAPGARLAGRRRRVHARRVGVGGRLITTSWAAPQMM